MRKPSPALIGSVALHAGVIGLALVTLADRKVEPKPLVSSVPVTIVSDMVVEAGPADNPQPEPSPEDGSTSPQDLPQAPEPTPAPPEPTPPPPAPTPRPTPAPRPTPTPAPRPTPTPTPPPRPTPPPAKKADPAPTPPRTNPTLPRTNPTPARPPAQREAPGLDLSDLAGPQRQTGNSGRPATGQQGRGSAPQAIGRPALQALGSQVRPQLNCDLVEAGETVRVTVRLDARGRLVRSPQLQTRATPASGRVVSAINAAVPFDMPSGYEEQDLPFVFNTADFC